MKITVSAASLQTCMNNIITFFSSGLGIMELTCLITTSGKKELLVECSGGGAYYTEIISNVKVHDKGKMAISVYYLYNLNLPDDEITMEVNKTTLAFSCGRLKGKFDTLAEGDPVERIDDKLKTALMIDADLYSKLVDAILFSPTVKDASNVLRFNANSEKKTLKVIAADTYRAAMFETKGAKSESIFKDAEKAARKNVEEKEKDKEKMKKAKEAQAKGKGKKAKEVEEIKAAVKKAKHNVFIKSDFDYVFPSSFLVAIKDLFQGKLELGANDKLMRMSDGIVTVYHPSQSKDVGSKVEKFIRGLENEKPVIVVSFDPEEADEIINAACSIASGDDGHVVLVPGKDRFDVKVRADHAETKASFDAKFETRKKDEPIQLSAKYFTEFLGLSTFFADEGVKMRVWPANDGGALSIETKDTLYLMPLLGE